VDPRYWAAVNGTEGNRTNRTTPDTEDLNLNGALDVGNDYVEYTIDLGDVSAEAPYLVTDVQRDFGPSSPAPVSTVTADNGWRRYRIPLDDTLAVEFGNPNLALVQHVRVWVQGVVESDPRRRTSACRCSCWAGSTSSAAAGTRRPSTRSRSRSRSRP
jgi:hypothetical protein